MIIPERRDGENARAYAIRVLMHNIETLQLPPGSPISENEISAQLHVSRTPVREALIELKRVNLVEIMPQRGSYVTKIDYNLIEEGRFLRTAVETAVFKQACQQIDDSNIELLEENIALQRIAYENHNAEKFLQLDNEFHAIVYRSVGKNWTYSIVREQMVHFDRLRSLSLSATLSDYVLQDHEDLLYAIKRRDEEMCAMLLTRHLTRHQLEKEKLEEQYPDYFIH